MKVSVKGKVLNVRSGKSKAGKDYVVADIYDGNDLVKVFGVDSDKVYIGEDVSLDCRLDVDWEKRSMFIVAVK